jgi:hypothetical protein
LWLAGYQIHRYRREPRACFLVGTHHEKLQKKSTVRMLIFVPADPVFIICAEKSATPEANRNFYSHNPCATAQIPTGTIFQNPLFGFF